MYEECYTGVKINKPLSEGGLKNEQGLIKKQNTNYLNIQPNMGILSIVVTAYFYAEIILKWGIIAS